MAMVRSTHRPMQHWPVRIRLLEKGFAIIHRAHRNSNDILGSTKSSGNFYLLLIMKLIYGLNTACWKTCKWHTEGLDFVKNLLRKFPNEVRVWWEYLLPRIAIDLGNKVDTSDPSWGDKLFATLVEDVFSGYGPKMALTQWASWAYATDWWDPRWHRRLFMLFIWCLFKDLFTTKGIVRVLDLKPLVPAIQGVADNVARAGDVQKKTEASLRNAGTNQVHTATLIYLQGWPLQRKFRGLREVFDPLIKSYQALRREAKSHEGIFKFYADMTFSESIGRLALIFARLQDPIVLKRLGFICSEADLPLIALDPAALKTIYDDENEWAAELVNMQVHAAGARLYSMLWDIEGIPGILPALLGFQADQTKRALKYLKDLDQLVELVRTKLIDYPDVARQFEVCFVNDPIPAQTLGILRAGDFLSVAEVLRQAIAGLFGLGQTVFNEQANRSCRNAADREADHNKVDK